MHRTRASRRRPASPVQWIFLLLALAPVAPAVAKPTGIFERLQSAARKVERNDCRGGLKTIAAVTKEAEFSTLDPTAREITYEMGAICALRLDDHKTAYRYALEATEHARSTAQLWGIRFTMELDGKLYSEAVATIEAMSSRHPEALDALEIRWLFDLHRELKKLPDTSLRRRLLDVLAAPSYRPDQVLATSDSFKYELAAIAIEQGDRARAASLIARMVEPSSLVEISVHKDMRSLLASDFDGRSAAEHRLAQARNVAAAHADSLSAVLRIAGYLRQLGRDEESLAVLEASRPDGSRAASFSDLEEQRNWWWDAVARAQSRLGRYDQAVAAFQAGIVAKEGGTLNVSQTINLGHLHLRFGHPERALATVAVFEKGGYAASPYGLMEMRLVRGCAQAALGNMAGARADIAYAVEHELDHPEALTDLLLCGGDMDGAAAAMIRRLDDPERRSAALLQLSDYDPLPSTYPLMPFERGLAHLAGRADIKAAVARAGGARRFRLQPGEL